MLLGILQHFCRGNPSDHEPYDTSPSVGLLPSCAHIVTNFDAHARRPAATTLAFLCLFRSPAMTQRPVLTAVDDSFIAPAPLPAPACKRPGCSNDLAGSARGRPREYCSPACGRRHARERERIAAEITRIGRLAEEYGVAEPQNPVVDMLSQELLQIRGVLTALVDALDSIEAGCPSARSVGPEQELMAKVAQARDQALARLARQQVLGS